MSNQFVGTPSATDLLTLSRAATVARLLAGVAHEVNNALQVIGGTTELLQITPGLPASVTEGLQRIAVQNTRAATALQEVMLFARQKMDATGRTNLREVADRSAALRAFAIGRARLRIAVDVPVSGRFLVTGNDGLLQLAVLNLIVNAEQALAGQNGGVIRLELEELPGYVVLLHDTTASRGERVGIVSGTPSCRTMRGHAGAADTGCWRVFRDAPARGGIAAGALKTRLYAAPRSRCRRCSLSMNVVRLKLSRRAA
jgi:nitrogen-specific signal transduction histidine kinase